MKTTLEIPDSLLREAKMRAIQKGTTLRAIVCQALKAELSGVQQDEDKGWRRHFGGLQHLHKESAKINAAVEEAFGHVDEDAWQ